MSMPVKERNIKKEEKKEPHPGGEKGNNDETIRRGQKAPVRKKGKGEGRNRRQEKNLKTEQKRGRHRREKKKKLTVGV